MPPLVIMGGLAAAGAIGGAAISSSASKSAAETQAQSGANALNVQKQMYDQTRSDLQPWVTQGSQAVGTLGALMGMGGTVNGQPVGGQTPSGGTTTLGQFSAPNQTPQQMGLVNPAQQNGGEDRMVTLQAPDGSTRQFPMSQAQRFISAGARLVQ